MKRKRRKIVEHWWAVKLYARSDDSFFALAEGLPCRPAIFASRKEAVRFADSITEIDTFPRPFPRRRDISIVPVSIAQL